MPDDVMARLDAGDIIDLSQSLGLLVSRKEAFAVGDRTYEVLHGIDGTVTRFNREHMGQVLDGERDPWDGTPELN